MRSSRCSRSTSAVLGSFRPPAGSALGSGRPRIASPFGVPDSCSMADRSYISNALVRVVEHGGKGEFHEFYRKLPNTLE